MIERRRLIGRGHLPKKSDEPDCPGIDTGDAVEAGRKAWGRLKDRSKATLSDWLLTAEAFEAGTLEVVTKTGSQRGSRHYNVEFGVWLQMHGFDEIDKSDRSKLRLILGDRDRIEAWRASLPDGSARST